MAAFGILACGPGSSDLAPKESSAPAAQSSLPPPAALPQPPARPSNLLLITVDTTRADALGAYGQPLDTSPEIDRLAREGVLFERAIASNPETLPSHSTLFTGRFPFAHGVRSNSGYVLPEQSVTLAEILAAAGFVTAAEVAALVMNPTTQIGQGFASYRDPDSPGVTLKKVEYVEAPEAELSIRVASDISRHGIDFIRTHRTRPFFLWLHYFDPHVPYSAPGNFNAKLPESPYHAEIASADSQIGRVIEELERLGLRDDTLVVLTSDHGEGLGEHGELTHSYFVYQSTMRIPLIFWGPRLLKQGTRVASVVRNADVAPTVLDLLGLPIVADMQGVSLRPLLTGETKEMALPAYGESIELAKVFAISPLRFVVEGRWKYIHKVNPELYDLVADPGELTNVAAANPEVVARLLSRLEDILAQANPASQDARAEVDAATRARLEALGYLVAPTGSALEGGIDDLAVSGRDPADLTHDVSEMGHVSSFLGREEYERALSVLVSLRERHPKSNHLLTLHAKLMLDLKRPREAIVLFRESLERDPRGLEDRQNLALLLEETGRLGEAIDVLLETLELGQCQDTVWSSLNAGLARQERYVERVSVLRRATELCADSSETLNNYAWALATSPDPRARDGARAVEAARRAVELVGQPQPAYLDTLAAAHAEAGNWAEAERVEAEALRMLERAGAPEAVRASFRASLERIRARQPQRDSG